jgi:hypothetical protein
VPKVDKGPLADGRYVSVELDRCKSNLLPNQPDQPLCLEIFCAREKEGETWIVRKIGSPQEIAAFIERTVPQSPAPELITSALEELNGRIPPGML